MQAAQTPNQLPGGPKQLLTHRTRRSHAQDGEVRRLAVNTHQLAPDEPLSPEIVLVLPPELRAQVLAALPAPAWPTPRRRATETPTADDVKPFEPSLSALLVSRVVQLGLVFVAVTIVVLALSLVASAMR